jgi:hypothetical protein
MLTMSFDIFCAQNCSLHKDKVKNHAKHILSYNIANICSVFTKFSVEAIVETKRSLVQITYIVLFICVDKLSSILGSLP